MKIIKKRTGAISVIFILWFIFILAYLFYFTVYSRYEYIKTSNSLSLREGKIPTVRGTIFDKNGVKLAWNLRNYNLYLKNISVSDKQKKHLIRKIRKIFPGIKIITEFHLDNNVIIKKNLTPEELISAQILLSTTPELTIRPTSKRITINIPKIKKYVGTVRYINDTWVGLSGIEKKNNSYLNGSDGLYAVMLDKDGKWIKGTGVNKKEMIPGKDIFLKESINDIINQGERRST
jgi:cell division protein FtsI/penicillin-binding protein 2